MKYHHTQVPMVTVRRTALGLGGMNLCGSEWGVPAWYLLKEQELGWQAWRLVCETITRDAPTIPLLGSKPGHHFPVMAKTVNVFLSADHRV